MKKNLKMKPAKEDKPKKKRGGYAGPRDQSTGLTPRQRLDIAKAEAQEFENRKNRENWQTREEAEAAAQETSEVIQGDLYGALPLSLAGKLAGKSWTPAQIREVVRAEVDLMVRQWVKGERVSEKATPKERNERK